LKYSKNLFPAKPNHNRAMKLLFVHTAILAFFFFCYAEENPSIDWKLAQYSDSLDVFLNDQPVGHLYESLVLNDSTHIITLSTTMNVSAGSMNSVSLSEKRLYNLNGNLAGASQQISGSSGANYWNLEQTPDSKWKLTVTAGGISNSKIIDHIGENLLANVRIRDGIRNNNIKAGDTWDERMFELTSASEFSQKTICKEIPCESNGEKWVFNTKSDIDERDALWEIDKNGKTILQQAFPYIARRHSTDLSKEKTGNGDVTEVLRVPASRGAASNEFIKLSFDQKQKIDSTVASFYKKENGDYLLKGIPEDGCISTEKNPDSTLIYAQPTTTMQSDDPEIISLAKKISSGVTDRCSLINKMNQYVNMTLKKRNTATFSSAIETLHAGFGDCGEHAVLLAALLRASSIPARIVVGLIYIDSKKGYYYHAWVMAYSGKWIFADPAFGVFPAKRDRVPLLIDDTGERMVFIAKLIGRIRISYAR
jgi:hypothetical protein